MRTTTLRRRFAYGVLSTGLLAAGVVPLTASAATAKCPTYVDPEGDAAPVEPAVTGAVLQDDGLDILSVTHSTAGGVLSSTVKTVQLLESGSDNSFGDWFEVGFTVAEKAVVVRVVRDANLQDTQTTRLQVDATTVPNADVKAVYDFKAATVTLSVTQAVLEKAIGSKLTGKPFSEMETLSYGYYGGPGLLFDDAVAADGATYAFGDTCKGGAQPAPAPAASGSSAPSPTAAPSAAASPRPSSSGSPSASGSASASPSPSASASPQPTVPVPAAGCFGFDDPKGDARPSGQAPNDPDLDILSVTGRSTDAVLAGHLRIDKLGTRPALPVFSGHRFEYQFNAGQKVVLLRANEEGEGVGLVDGAAAPDLKVEAAFDVVSSQVVLSVTRASLEAVLGRELPDGTFVDAQVGRSIARTATPVVSPADTASSPDPVRARYTLGDNTCFAPRLSVSLPASVQTSDRALVSVAMTTSDGRIVGGQVVTARVGDGRAVSGRTDKQGTVNLRVPVTDAAGAHQLVVRSSGSAGRGELLSDVRVVVERTLLTTRTSGTGSVRAVTALLTDDDSPRRALARQRLVFSFGGRSVAVTTDRSGRASVRVPAGSTVEVAYAGRSGFLGAAKVRTAAR